MTLEQSASMRFPIQPCQLILGDLKMMAGADSTACNELPSAVQSIDCANRQFRKKGGFTLCHGGWGMDSRMESGVAGMPNGNLGVIYLDTFGPTYRGVCLRQNVVLSATGWPVCTTELASRTDLRTGQPYVEPGSKLESWSEGCEARAARALRLVQWPRALKRRRLLSEPNAWNQKCSRLSLTVTMLIDRSGRVACVAVPKSLSPPGLADEVRRNLLGFRFEPAKIYGVPVEGRWTVSASGCEFPGGAD